MRCCQFVTGQFKTENRQVRVDVKCEKQKKKKKKKKKRKERKKKERMVSGGEAKSERYRGERKTEYEESKRIITSKCCLLYLERDK